MAQSGNITKEFGVVLTQSATASSEIKSNLIIDAAAVPLNPSTDKIILYNESGVLKAKEDDGTITQLVPAAGGASTTFADDVFAVQDNADATKQVLFDAGGTTSTSTTITAAQTANRVITLPDATDTLAGKATTDAFTNKTITATSNDVAAGKLHSATTVVDVISATAPTNGQVLTATGGTAATWQAPAAGSWDTLTGTAADVSLTTGQGNPTYAEGLIFYDDTEKALGFYNDESEVTQQLGQEGLIRIRNQSGSTIGNGQVVYITSTADAGGENRPVINLARSNDLATSQVLGIATHSIENNTYGYVTYWGLVNDLNTNSFDVGDRLYLSSAAGGALVVSPPTDGNYQVFIGFVVRKHLSAGRIFVGLLPELKDTIGSGITLSVFNDTGGALAAGKVVYISGFDATNDVPEVDLADADDPSKMPAIGITTAQITDQTLGSITLSGRVNVFDTTAIAGGTAAIGDAFFVSTTAGDLTLVKPNGTSQIQKMGIVTETGASGVVQVIGAGRSNDVSTRPAEITKSVVTSTVADDANALTADNMFSLVADATGLSASRSKATRTAAELVGDFAAGGAVVGSTYKWYVAHDDGVNTLTITAGTGVTLSDPRGLTHVIGNETADYLLTFTNVTAASEAVTLLRLR